ncbi:MULTISPECIES: hypothetical protein [Photorhabdus]|uniref:Uncharacterized protein n=1 Tax=Photorhabdus luminescens subsp. mexicana TaxID=2100167 RepID=A0A4R4ITL1_PHOLU|nr:MULTISPECIES: hypothetical protein [Photorhabdus]MCT8345200.1 hypothetical protein [Photorhabdus kleinii]TDB44153.1 hypothetical protein C5468_22920 [Photorhabdus luminescens subsp. mexicana]
MSNDVRGYFELSDKNMVNELIHICEKKYDLGIEQISRETLYNFPEDFIPKHEENYFSFVIGDSPGETISSYLIDYIDYAPEADIGFPVNGKERLDILLSFLSDAVEISKVTKLVIALTDCNQIEITRRIHVSEIYEVIHSDFEKYQSPPDTLYEITCN